MNQPAKASPQAPAPRRAFRIEVALIDGRADVEGAAVLSALEDLGLEGVREVRTVRVYAVEGSLDGRGAERLAAELFTDPLVERYAVDGRAVPDEGRVALEVVRKPGVMEPVEASALQGARELGVPVHSVRTAKRYLFDTRLPPEQLMAAAGKVIANEVIETIVPGRDPLRRRSGAGYTLRRVVVPLREASGEQLARISAEGHLALSAVEMRAVQDYYRRLERDPTDVELETLAQTWSEHCRHKTLRGAVRLDGEAPARFANLLRETIMRATETIAAPWCLSVFEDNAGVVAFDEDHALCFKVETHNHPSALEPYGGAGTGLGGCIRDVLGTGLGARPIACTDVFAFAPLETPHEALPPGVLHPKRLLKGVVAGVRDYGNRMGIPTVSGAVLFDPRYLGNPLVFCGTIGLMPRAKVSKAPRSGDLIVVAGGRTGRDGIHGATFSSLELSTESETVSSGAVQIGNAIEEKKLLEAILAARDEGLFTSITDCGAGGLSSAVGEMGEALGAEVDLEKVPLKYHGLSYTEIWISEAQERMVLAVPPDRIAALEELFADEQVEATVIGRFTGDRVLRLRYEGQLVGELDMAFLHGGLPRVERQAHWESPVGDQKTRDARLETRDPEAKKTPDDLGADLRRILASPNVCSKEWIIRQYDHEVQAGTIIKPLLGVDDAAPSDAAVIAPLPTSTRAVAIAAGINPLYGELDPYRMAASAIDEAVRNCVAVGARFDRIALLDNFAWGNTELPDRLGALVRACQACRDVAIAYRTPFISGKDSLNNEFRVSGFGFRVEEEEDSENPKPETRNPERTLCIPHTLLISALGIVDDYRRCVTMDAKAAGDPLYVVGLTREELGGSHWLRVASLQARDATPQVPGVDLETAPRLFQTLSAAMAEGHIRACHDLSEGGLAVSAAEMAFAGDLGLEIDLERLPADNGLSAAVRLFSESNTRWLVEVVPERAAEFERAFEGLPCAPVGRVIAEPVLRIREGTRPCVEEDLAGLRAAWQGGLRLDEA